MLRVSPLFALPLAGLSVLVETTPAPRLQTGSLTVTGSLTYLARIALPPDSVAIVELRQSPAPDEGPAVAEQRIAIDGRQVPIAFELSIDRSRLTADARHVIRGAILSGGRPSWVSGDVPVDTSAPAIDVGEIRLNRAPAQPLPFTASGNEPGWRLEILEEQLTLVTDNGDTTIRIVSPTTETIAGGHRYAGTADGRTVTATVLDRLCRDTMTGMPRPHAVEVTLDSTTLRGCGGDPAALLRGEEWVVEDIDGTTPVAESRVTLTFGDDGRVSGSSSCNRYSGAYTLTGEGLTVGRTMGTMMACEERLMEQETAFLEILRAIRRFDVRDDGSLVLYDADARTITARR